MLPSFRNGVEGKGGEGKEGTLTCSSKIASKRIYPPPGFLIFFLGVFCFFFSPWFFVYYYTFSILIGLYRRVGGGGGGRGRGVVFFFLHSCSFCMQREKWLGWFYVFWFAVDCSLFPIIIPAALSFPRVTHFHWSVFFFFLSLLGISSLGFQVCHLLQQVLLLPIITPAALPVPGATHFSPFFSLFYWAFLAQLFFRYVICTTKSGEGEFPYGDFVIFVLLSFFYYWVRDCGEFCGAVVCVCVCVLFLACMKVS